MKSLCQKVKKKEKTKVCERGFYVIYRGALCDLIINKFMQKRS